MKRSEDVFSETLAGVRMAEELIAEAQITLSYTEITAPSDGEVLKRLVDPGDLAMPGKPLLLLRTAGGLRLEAHVRESIVDKIHPGSTLPAELPTLQQTVDSQVAELIPYADARTRTFLVKAALPDIPGLYPGMYGKLRIPYMEIDIVLIPEKTIDRVGQLELVIVKTPDGWKRRYIKTGNRYGEKVEVLSGLLGHETLKVMEPGNAEYLSTNSFLQSVGDVEELVVGAYEYRPVYLRNISTVIDGPAEAEDYTRIGYSHRHRHADQIKEQPLEYPAVTLSLAKKPGANAVDVSRHILSRLEELKENMIPQDVLVEVTRNYGYTAQAIIQTLKIAVGGDAPATVHMRNERQPLHIKLILPRKSRSSMATLTQIPIATPDGKMVPLAELVTFEQTLNTPTIYHKNLDRVVYVLSEVAGRGYSWNAEKIVRKSITPGHPDRMGRRRRMENHSADIPGYGGCIYSGTSGHLHSADHTDRFFFHAGSDYDGHTPYPHRDYARVLALKPYIRRSCRRV